MWTFSWFQKPGSGFHGALIIHERGKFGHRLTGNGLRVSAKNNCAILRRDLVHPQGALKVAYRDM